MHRSLEKLLLFSDTVADVIGDGGGAVAAAAVVGILCIFPLGF